jgi:hypothetical protein
MRPTNVSHRWLRLRRHLRSLSTPDRVTREADRAVRGEFPLRRRSLCGHRSSTRRTRVAG